MYTIFGKVVVHIFLCKLMHFYPNALKGCQGIVFTHGVQMDGRVGTGKKFVWLVSQKP